MPTVCQAALWICCTVRLVCDPFDKGFFKSWRLQVSVLHDVVHCLHCAARFLLGWLAESLPSVNSLWELSKLSASLLSGQYPLNKAPQPLQAVLQVPQHWFVFGRRPE